MTSIGDARQPLDELTREELIARLRDREEGVHLTFEGKEVARRIARRVQPRTLRRVPALSVGDEASQARNLIIEGENLQSLVTLYKERGQVDLILTDPPYNTGNDFRYNDRWDEDPNDPGLGEFIEADTPGRRSTWMKFMWPRLKVMRDMLKPTGVLAICIDYRELFHLGEMLDELFMPENRLGIINWQKSYSPKSDKKHVSTATEYVLVYAKELSRARTGALPRTEAANARYKNDDGDVRLWKGGDASGPGAKTHQGMVYGIQSPFTGEIFYPQVGSCWRSEKKYVKEWLEQWGSSYVERDLGDDDVRAEIIGRKVDDIKKSKALVLKSSSEAARKRALSILEKRPWPKMFFGMKGDGRPQLKVYLEEVKQGFVPVTYWANDDYDEPLELGPVSWEHKQSGHSQTGIDELDAIIGSGHGFETVKPLRLFKKIIQIWCPNEGLVLDPFAGSGTTGHAVLDMNYSAGANRRFILIEQGRPERGDSYARTLTAARVSRAVSGDWAAGPATPLSGGVRFCQLQKKVDARALLGMERDEMTDTVIASHYDSTRRGSGGLEIMTRAGYQYLVAKNSEREGFYLVWNGSATSPVFDEDVYEIIVKEADADELKPIYHVYARFNYYQSDDVRFYQIPDRILLDFGIGVHDAFNNEPD